MVNGPGPPLGLGDDGSPFDDAGRLLEGRITGYRPGSRPISRRLFLFSLGAVLIFGGLAVRLADLQLAEGGYYRSLAEHNRVRRLALKAPRGILYDRRGVQLVENVPNQTLALVPADLPRGPRRLAVLHRVEQVVGVASPDLEKVVQAHAAEPFEPATVRRDLSADQALVLQEEEPDLPGVAIEILPSRHYLQPLLTAHLVGYTGAISDQNQYQELKSEGYLIDDPIGKAGLESTAEVALRGTYGQRVVETDVKGQVVKELARRPSQPGADVRLHLDLEFQQAVTGFLQDALDQVRHDQGAGHGNAGTAIVMDPRDGAILSMISLPTYDVNEFAGGISSGEYARLLQDPGKPLLDRAISGEYPPGSTFKQVTAAAALQEGRLSPHTVITCRGALDRAGYPFYCWNRGGHGPVDLVGAVAQSCDVYFYTAADLLGDVTLARYSRLFGIGAPTGVELGNERNGLAPDRDWKAKYFRDNGLNPEPWYVGDTLHCGIGQGYVLVTPLQLARITAAVANGGNLFRPTLIRSSGAAGSPPVPGPPRLERTLGIDPAHLAVIRAGMRASVTSGTSYMLNGRPWEGAGKTGTAEYGTPDAKGVLPSHAWFTAFAPLSAPEISVTVFVEGGGEGSKTAQPVALKALDFYFANRQAIRGA